MYYIQSTGKPTSNILNDNVTFNGYPQTKSFKNFLVKIAANSCRCPYPKTVIFSQSLHVQVALSIELYSKYLAFLFQ